MKVENLFKGEAENVDGLQSVLCSWQRQKIASPPTCCTWVKHLSRKKNKNTAILGNKMAVGASGGSICCAIHAPSPAQGGRQILTA